ncbi:hypothetical protein DSL72_001690 [Monilinia vaccinii-corymbosi]|uniref:Uncharacterized protein n=1 Tax=Monilinia vaccinii-corymbosi TaxID=61207 RepID=A0A8A3P822_9HELO|nr:hypothetical protein DSL72_001690 [Monilinia vaccinii-corymbosi]
MESRGTIQSLTGGFQSTLISSKNQSQITQPSQSQSIRESRSSLSTSVSQSPSTYSHTQSQTTQESSSGKQSSTFKPIPGVATSLPEHKSSTIKSSETKFHGSTGLSVQEQSTWNKNSGTTFHSSTTPEQSTSISSPLTSAKSPSEKEPTHRTKLSTSEVTVPAVLPTRKVQTSIESSKSESSQSHSEMVSSHHSHRVSKLHADSASGILIRSQTLLPGSVVTVDGTVVSLSLMGNAVVVNGNGNGNGNGNANANASSGFVTRTASWARVVPVSSLVIGGQMLTAGGMVTEGGDILSLAAGGPA